jgi:Protein of unknown function (DUF2934)
MAGKPPKKSNKNTSSTKNTVKAASTVTRIDAIKGGETQSRVPQIVNSLGADHKSADHKIANHEIAEQIRVRAYELFEQRGRHEGYEHEDWVQAEAEILSKYQRGKSA